MNRVLALSFAALIAVAAVVAGGVRWWVGPPDARENARAALESPPGWTPVAWPFLNDQFGKGKSFDCAAKDCGANVRVTFRAKIGFCNCATGVSDDEELERIGDVHMIGERFATLADGQPVVVGHMKGRSRPYSIDAGDANLFVMSVAFNDRCDVIVATAQSRDATPDDFERPVMAFLTSAYVLRWAELTIGL